MLQEVFCEGRRSSCVSAPQHVCPTALGTFFLHVLPFSAWPKVVVKYLFRS